MAWLGIAVGALAAFMLSLLLWWVQYRVAIPTLLFGEGISRLTSDHGVVYRFKITNTGRRGAIDLSFHVTLHLGRGRIAYHEATVTETENMLRIFPATERLMRMGPGVSRIVRLDLRPSLWQDVGHHILEAAGIDPESRKVPELEDLLMATPTTYLTIGVLAYDEISGSRKYFRSKRYLRGHIQTGAFKGLAVGRPGGW